MTSRNLNNEISEELACRLDTFDPKNFEQQPTRQLYKTKPRSFILMVSNPSQYFFYSHIEGDVGVCITLGQDKTYVHLDPYMLVIPVQKKSNFL